MLYILIKTSTDYWQWWILFWRMEDKPTPSIHFSSSKKAKQIFAYFREVNFSKGECCDRNHRRTDSNLIVNPWCALRSKFHENCLFSTLVSTCWFLTSRTYSLYVLAHTIVCQNYIVYFVAYFKVEIHPRARFNGSTKCVLLCAFHEVFLCFDNAVFGMESFHCFALRIELINSSSGANF